MIYGKSELFRKLSEIAKKGWSNTQVRDLIDSLWRDPYSLRTSGFNLPGGTDADIELVAGFYEGSASGSGDDIYSLQLLISPDKKKFSFYQYRYKLTYHKKTLLESVEIPTTEGLHFIYYDFYPVTKTETLHVSSPPYLVTPGHDWLIVNRCMVASVYYDADKMEAIVFNDQRYGSEWNPQMHKTLRNTLGSLRDFGLAFTDLTADDEGDEDIHAQFGISGGGVWHGDIYKTSSGVSRGTMIPIMYFNTADNPRIIENPGWAVKFGSLLQYQNYGVLTDAQEEYFVLYHIFHTNCLYNEFISVPGIAEYEKLADAGLAMQDELENVKELLPYTDFLHIGTLIFQTSAAFTNAAHSRIVSYNFTVFTEMSVQGNGNLSDKIKLVNDEETPDAGTFYGAHYETGEKGFHGIDPRLMGSGQAIFLHSNDSDVSGYKQALPVSPEDAMATYTVAADSSLGEVLLKAFVTDAGYPGVTVIPAGAWIFDLWLAVSGGSASSVVVRVYKRDTGGTETELFNFEQPVTANVGVQYLRAVAQNMIEIADDDRLAIKLFHKNDALTSRTMYLFVEGDTLAEYKWSNVRIPLAPVGGNEDNYVDGATFDEVTRDLTLTRTGILEDLVVNIPCCEPSDMIDGATANVKFGALYNWWAATDARNIAPAGWHVPTRAELQALETHLGGATVAGGELKETGDLHWDSNIGATNGSGFNGRGAGYRLGGLCQEIRIDGWYWSVTEGYFTDTAYILRTFNDSALSTTDYYLAKDTGLPIRLIKDDSVNTGTMVGNDGKVYPTVKIGDQVWMAVNSTETQYRTGADITGPTFTDAAWWALLTEAYCIYGDDHTNAEEENVQLQHNLLGGLQGGNGVTERYHHTATEIAEHVYEAPEDGKQYARKDGVWEEITAPTGGGDGVIEFRFKDFVAGAAQSWDMDINCEYPYTIKHVWLRTDSGTLTGVAVKINGTAVTGMDNITVTSTKGKTEGTALNAVVADDTVTLVITTGYSGAPAYIGGHIYIERT